MPSCLVQGDDLRKMRKILTQLYWSEHNSLHWTDHRLVQLMDAIDSMLKCETPWFCGECLKDE